METAEKPFKTIEVIDNDTKQICKIACMSCIRGHRTTSCGIPVCRTKLFWTVKRPGRPSNSCTCRFHSSGVCKCVTSLPKCPHKSKKGEKRSGECRCDEHGRFCCLVEPEHWEILMQLLKPTIQFFPNREALEAWHAAAAAATTTTTHRATPPITQSITDTPMSTTFFNITPNNTNQSSCCGTPSQQPTCRVPPSSLSSPADSGIISPQSNSGVMVPSFGYSAVGTPMISAVPSPIDVMGWDAAVSMAPTTPSEEFQDAELSTMYTSPSLLGSCCQNDDTDMYSGQSQQQQHSMAAVQQVSCCGGGDQGYADTSDYSIASMQFQQVPYNPHTYQTLSDASPAPPQSPAAFDFERWNQNYHMYQYPNAICQNCGLNGCTCRSCPPLMQNFGTTSWAQSCGRRHARIAPIPPSSQMTTSTMVLPHHAAQFAASASFAEEPLSTDQLKSIAVHQHPQSMHMPEMEAMEVHDLHSPNIQSPYQEQALSPQAHSEHLNYDNYLVTDVDRSNHAIHEQLFGS